jgi:hypothetical protein
MAHRLIYIDPRDKARERGKDYLELDDALGAAQLAWDRGAHVRRIQTDDGAVLMPGGIERLILDRGDALKGRPSAY